MVVSPREVVAPPILRTLGNLAEDRKEVSPRGKMIGGDASQKGRRFNFSQAPPEVHWLEDEGDEVPEVAVEVTFQERPSTP